MSLNDLDPAWFDTSENIVHDFILFYFIFSPPFFFRLHAIYIFWNTTAKAAIKYDSCRLTANDHDSGEGEMKYTVKQKRVNSRHRRSTRRSTKTQASLPSNSISTKVFAPGILPSPKITALFSRAPPVPCSDIGTDAYFSSSLPSSLLQKFVRLPEFANKSRALGYTGRQCDSEEKNYRNKRGIEEIDANDPCSAPG